MITLQHCKAGIAIAAMFAVSGAFAATGDKTDYKAAKDRISAENKADKAVCDSYSGNKKDICAAEAKMKRDVAKADLDANLKNTADARRAAVIKKVDAEYDVAKEKCDDLAGNAKDVCVKDAKAAREKAKTSAKSMKT